MKTLHFVCHTHWDREWYLTFQQFRFRLVQVIDQVLDLLDKGIYDYFTLDGQTITLDDYLDIRPDEEPHIRRLVQEGKLLVGPWAILPDEFLEGPEAMIRNLLAGRRACRRFSDEVQPMEQIGYIPDTFGHISQLAQIAAGFGQDTVCFWRGVGEAPTELWWAAADGTERLLLHLRDSYSNAAFLARDEPGFIHNLETQIESLAPHTPTSHLLMMFGTDHMPPQPELPERLRAAAAALGYRMEQSTLPRYLAAVCGELGTDGLAALSRRQGEMRSPQRAHLLPAVLSTRLWIKQWNARCEALLTRWAEPFSALAEQLAPGTFSPQRSQRGFIRQAWHWLLQNHPHDSICGCSIDQVHDEMRTRFAWSEQISEQVTQASLQAIAGQVRTTLPSGLPALPSDTVTAAVVFNPTPATRSDRVRVRIEPAPQGDFDLVDETGQPVPYRVLGYTTREQFAAQMDRLVLEGWLAQIAPGEARIAGDFFFRRLDLRIEDSTAFLDVAVTAGPGGAAPAGELQAAIARLRALLDDPTVGALSVRLVEDCSVDVEMLARDVPGVGYRTYWAWPRPGGAGGRALDSGPDSTLGLEHATPSIENEFFRVEADPITGVLTITDKDNGLVLRGANRFVDGGDRGDEYTFTRPENDQLIDQSATPPSIRTLDDGLGPVLDIRLVYRLPQALAAGDRSRRSAETIELPITSRVYLTPGVRRVEFETTVDNLAHDHRLRVHFSTPVVTDRTFAESHFDVVERSIALPTSTAGWAEQPVGTQPQLGFVDVTDRRQGVMLINRGLPEYEALTAAEDGQGITLALTLLRCVGWLSRADLHNRMGHAGPATPTPGAQCPGSHTFHYAVAPHVGNYLTAFGQAAAFNAPLRGAATMIHDGRLPAVGTYVTVSPSAVALSAIKTPDNGQGLIVRVYNAAPVPVQARLALWQPFQQATQVPLSEDEPQALLAENTNAVTLPLRAKEIATIHLQFPASVQAISLDSLQKPSPEV